MAASGAAEGMAPRFLAAQQVRHSTTTSFAETGEGAGLTRGQRLDPATLPTLEALQETLRELPSGFRLEGESVWPLPPGYRAPPVRFTDVTNEPPPALMPAPDMTTEPTVAPDRTRRAPRWTTAAALLVLVAGAWELGQRWDDPPSTARTPSATPVATAPPAAPAETAEAGSGARAAASDAAGPVDPPTEPPTPNRPSTSAARSPASPRRPEAAAPRDASAQRRDLCRRYAESVTRGNALPQIVQFYRTQCL